MKDIDFDKFMLVSEAITIDLMGLDGEPLCFIEGKPAKVKLYPPSSDAYIRAKAAMDKEAQARVMASLMKKGANKKHEEDKDADIKFLCAVTQDFENFPYPGGKEAIYREPRWLDIHNQVREAYNDLGKFSGAGKKA